MKTLVTGSTGFIGRHVVGQLVRSGASVRALERHPGPDGNGLVEHIRGDVLDPRSVDRAIEECDTIYHLAAYAHAWAKSPSAFFDVNVGGTRCVLDAALRQGVRRVVVTSSVVTMGSANGQPASESTPRHTPALTQYERSKVAEEETALEYSRRGLEVVIVNPTRVFGPGLLNEGNSATRMIRMYLDGVWRVLPGDGRTAGNYAYVGDVARGHILAMAHGRSGERYILGGENASYNEFFTMLGEIAGARRFLLHFPRAAAIAVAGAAVAGSRMTGTASPITPGWVRMFYGNGSYCIEKAIAELGYTVTPLPKALEATVAWLRRGAPPEGEAV